MATMYADVTKEVPWLHHCMQKMHTDWINLVLSICYIVPEGVEYIRKQGGVYEIYYNHPKQPK